jgi:hypothetical protein
MRLKLLCTNLLLVLSSIAISQTGEQTHKEEPARPIKTYQGVKEVKQLFFLPTEDLKACFYEQKIPIGFPSYNVSLDEAYNKNQIKIWLEATENREKLNEKGLQKLERYTED